MRKGYLARSALVNIRFFLFGLYSWGEIIEKPSLLGHFELDFDWHVGGELERRDL